MISTQPGGGGVTQGKFANHIPDQEGKAKRLSIYKINLSICIFSPFMTWRDSQMTAYSGESKIPQASTEMYIDDT